MLSPSIIAQCSAKVDKLYAKAKDKHLTDNDEAISLLEKALDRCPNSEKVIFLLADIYGKKHNVIQVEKLLSGYVQQAKNINPKAYFFLANAEKELFQLDDAIDHYHEYLDSNAKSRKLRTKASRNLAHAQFAKSSYANPPATEFIPFANKVNSVASEYLPIMTADESTMVFTRRETVAEETYFIEKLSDGTWTTPSTLTGLPQEFRKAAVSMSIDGNMLVFAMADHPDGIGNFDLYFMEIKDGRWTQPTNFGPLVNTPGWESQPCISADGRTVYFSAERRGGEGGHDIWKTKRERDGSWSSPTNLGLEINGPGDEESPFIHRDQRTLYFRSNTHPGLGDFDIFMSRIISFKKWREPLNLGYPINTIGNDGSLFVSLDGKEAFIASDVDHTDLTDYKHQTIKNHIDIYEFKLSKEFRPIPTTYVKMSFVDSQYKMPLQPQVELVDFRNGDTLYFGESDANGELLVCLPMHSEYALSAVDKHYLPHFERFEPLHESWPSTPTSKTIILNPVRDEVAESPAPVILQNVLFNTNEDILQTASYRELGKLISFLNSNPELNIVIRGHTDDVGDAKDNLDLSMRRAKTVYLYLIEQEIEASRLQYEGLGEQQPIGDNTSESGRMANRRTDFLIVY